MSTIASMMERIRDFAARQGQFVIGVGEFFDLQSDMVTKLQEVEKMASGSLQELLIERRIPIAMMGDTTDFLCPEITTLYKVVTKNISTLEYSTDNKATWKPLATNGAINAELPIDVIYFRVLRKTVDAKAYISFSGKAKI